MVVTEQRLARGREVANGKPEIKDGFVQLAHELDAALDIADFTKAERVVFREIKSQCFGAAKRKVARIMPIQLAARYGYPRQFTRKGLTSLIASGVLTSVGRDDYAYNKYYRTWTFKDGSVHDDGNGSRFSDSELSQIATAADLARAQGRDVTPAKTPKSGPNGVPAPDPTGSQTGPNGVPNGTQRGPDPDPTGSQPLYKNAGASEDLIQTEEDSQTKGKQAACEPAKGGDASEFYQKRADRTAEIAKGDDGSLPGSVTPDPEVIARTLAFVDAHFPMVGFDLKVTDHKRHFPSAWFLKAFKRLKLRGGRFQWGAVHRMLLNWHEAGVPEPGVEDDLDDQLSPVALAGIAPAGEPRASPAPAIRMSAQDLKIQEFKRKAAEIKRKALAEMEASDEQV